MSDIDNLQIKIKGESKSAIKEIDSAIGNLKKLSEGLETFSGKVSSFSGNFKEVTTAFKNIANSINSVSTDKLKDFTNALNGVSRAVNKINDTVNKLDFSHISSEMKLAQKVSKEGAKSLSEAFNVKDVGTQKELSQNLEKWIASVDEVGKITKETEEYKSAVEATKQAQKEVGDTIRENARIIDDTKGVYSDLIDYMQSTNKSGRKVFLPFSPSEFKDDYSSMRATLGKAFTSDKAFSGSGDITEFVKELNSQLGNIIPVADNEADTFSNLVRVVKEARDATLSYDEAIKKGVLDGKELSELLGIIVSKYVKEKEALASTGQSLGKEGNNFTLFAEQLKKIEDIKAPDTEKIETFAKAVRELGYKSVDKAIQNMPKLAEGLKGIMETLSKAPQVSQSVIQMTNAIANLASQGGKVGAASKNLIGSMGKIGNSSKSLVGKFGGLSKSMDRAKHHTHSLAAAFGKFYASYFMLIRGTKQLGKSIKSAMDYIEILNYFDAAFGKVAESAKDNFEKAGYESAEAYAKSFSDRAKAVTEQMSGFKITDTGELIPNMKKSLGMNPEELMQYQTVFAQMSDSMGVTAETSLKLSNALTKIGADLASVRNMNFDEVWKDMQSGLVGMSRTLDKYGINVRNVNMQQELSKLGIYENINALNQNNKAILRSIIILDSARFAWGDLANTLSSPANQLRIVKANFANLARTIGELFIPIVAKVLPVINALLVALERLAKFIGKLFGIKFKGSKGGGGGGGVFDFGEDAAALDNAAAGAGDLGSGLEKADKNAKKLHDHLLGIDELNVYKEEEEPSTGGGGGGGGAGGGGIDTGLLESALDDILSEYERVWDEAFNRMENRAGQFADNVAKAFKKGGLEGVGEYLSTELEKQLRKIDWDKVYRAVSNFGTGLANFLNGLIRPETFEAVGETVAGVLNTAIYLAFSVGNRFKFDNLGESIAAGINGAIKKFNFGLLAQTINTWVLGILDTMITAIKKTDWGLIGRKIGEFLEKIDFGKIGLKIGKLLWESIVAGIKFWIKSFNVAPIETLLITALGFNKFKSSKLYQQILEIGRIVKDTVRAIAGDTVALGALSENFPKFARAVDVARQAFEIFKIGINDGNFGTGVVLALQTIRENLTGFQKGMIGVVTSAAEFVVVKNAFADIASGTEHLALKIAEIGTAVVAAGAIMTTVFGPTGAVITGLVALGGAIAGVNSAMKKMAESSMWEALETNGGVSLEALGNVAIETFENITSGVDRAIEKLNSISKAREGIDGTIENLGLLKSAIENGAYTAEEKIPEIVEQFNSLLNQSKIVFEQEYNTIVGNMAGAWKDYMEAQGVAVPEAIANLAQLREGTTQAYDDIQAKVNELEKQYEEGTLSSEEYYQQLAPLLAQMQAFSQDGQIDESIKKLNDFGISLDMSKFIQNGELDTSKFHTYMSDVTDTAVEGKDKITELGEKQKSVLDDYIAKLRATGKEVPDYLLTAYGANENQTAENKEKMNTAYQQFQNVVQEKLLEDLPSVYEKASKDYDKKYKGKLIKPPKAEYIQGALNDWKKQALEPLSSEIESGYKQLEIDADPWVTEAAEKMIGSLFEHTVSYSMNGVEQTTVQLKENWKSILDGALDGASKAVDVEGYGKNAVEGFNKGVSDNSSLTNEAILKWIGDGINNVATALDSHSPSRVMADYGKFTVEGFNQGIENNKGTTKGVLDSWIGNVVDSFSSPLNSIKEIWGNVSTWFNNTVITPLGNFFKNAWESITMFFSNALKKIKEVWGGCKQWFSDNIIEPLKNSFQKALEKISDFFHNSWEKIKEIWNIVATWFNNTIIEPLKNFFQSAWEKIKGFFTSAWTTIKSVWNAVATWFSNTVITPLKSSFYNAWEKIKGFFKGAWDNIKSVWNGASTWFNNTIIEPLKSFFQSAWENIKRFFSDAWDNIKLVWNKASGWFRDNVINPVKKKFTALKDDIGTAFSDAWDIVTGIWDNISDWFYNHVISPISTMLSHIKRSASEAISSARSAKEESSKSTYSIEPMEIQGYAVGGYPNRADLFFANEYGVPELVGTMNGRTAVASGTEITGISNAVYESGNQQAKLLQTAIDLLEIISSKDTSIQVDGRELVAAYNNRKNRNGFSFT